MTASLTAGFVLVSNAATVFLADPDADPCRASCTAPSTSGKLRTLPDPAIERSLNHVVAVRDRVPRCHDATHPVAARRQMTFVGNRAVAILGDAPA